MKPAPFEYFRPRSMDEALDLLAAHGPDAKPLAGGQSLIPAMNFRLATPAVLVDLNEIAGLSNVTSGDGFLRVGAMTRHRSLERSETVAARGAARRRRDAVHRARRDSHARDARRQPRARRSGRRAAGRDARARRGLHAAKRPGLADGLRHRLLHRAVLHRPRAGRTPDRDGDSPPAAAQRATPSKRWPAGTATTRWPGRPRRWRSTSAGRCTMARDCAVERRRSAGAGRARPPGAASASGRPPTRFAAPPTPPRRTTSIHRATFMPRARTGGISRPC